MNPNDCKKCELYQLLLKTERDSELADVIQISCMLCSDEKHHLRDIISLLYQKYERKKEDIVRFGIHNYDLMRELGYK